MDNQSFPHRRDDQADAEVIVRDHRPDGREVEIDIEVRHENGREVIEIDIVDVEECGRQNLSPPAARRYKVKIDKDYFIFDHRLVSGSQLLERAGKTPVERYELEKRLHGGHYVSISLEEKVDLGECGIEVFETFPLDETEG